MNNVYIHSSLLFGQMFDVKMAFTCKYCLSSYTCLFCYEFCVIFNIVLIFKSINNF